MNLLHEDLARARCLDLRAEAAAYRQARTVRTLRRATRAATRARRLATRATAREALTTP